jgi:hypothetical protein
LDLGVWPGLARGQAITPGDSPAGVGSASMLFHRGPRIPIPGPLFLHSEPE